MMIPHIIHYCWFGGKPLPKSAKRCIASWKKYFPNYEIKEWNESNFDFDICEYVKEAVKEKRWAFVSDYARFWILYHEGGIYFDTDVEVIRNMDSIIENGAFMGCETKNTCAAGLGLAAQSGETLYKEILDYYDQCHYGEVNGRIETVVDHVTSILKRKGWEGTGKIETVSGIKIYPPEYFCPMDYKTGEICITENTYTIHWYKGSWQSNYSRIKTKIKYLLGDKLSEKVINIKKILKHNIY